jgi:hypothetical protein
MISKKATIVYRDFYDVPRIFLVSHWGVQYLFDCKFDDDSDEYPDRYKVFIVPPLTDKDLSGSWDRLSGYATEYLGEVPVKSVKFDETLRQAIDADVIEQLLKGTGNCD